MTTQPSATPRTDKEWEGYVRDGLHDAGQQFARTLETELARLRAEVERLEMCNSELHGIIDNAGYPSGVDYDREKARAERAERALAELKAQK